MKSGKIATSIIEAMIVILIVTIGILGVYEMYIRSLRVTNNLENKVQAIQIAREGIEAMSNIRDTNWLKFVSDKKNCWLTLNYSPKCVGYSSSSTSGEARFIEEGSYIIHRDNYGRRILAAKDIESNYLDTNYRDSFKVMLDENGLYTQSGGVKDMALTFTREIKITAVEAFPGETPPYKNAINVKSIVRWIDISSTAPQEVLLETVLTNHNLSHGQNVGEKFNNVGKGGGNASSTPSTPTCPAGNIWNGTNCEPDTKTFTCTNLPDNAVWTNTNSATNAPKIEQTTTDLIIRTPLEASLAPQYSDASSVNSCNFKCITDEFVYYDSKCINKTREDIECQELSEGEVRSETSLSGTRNITQKLTSGAWEPPTTKTYNPDTTPNQCYFRCTSDYTWNSTDKNCIMMSGVCGTAHNTDLDTKPSSNEQLCANGTASPVSGTGPWTWTCTSTGGTTNCNTEDECLFDECIYDDKDTDADELCTLGEDCFSD